ncbi:MAG TPA: hypothetical protein VGJ06_02360, partial [Candidatus Acidoferrum sp.]
MGEWISRVTNHRIWELMATLGASIDSATKIEQINSDALEALERLRLILTFCGKRLGGTDPLTIAIGTLDAIATLIENIISQIVEFAADLNVAHLVDANTDADKILARLAEIPAIATAQELVELTEAARSHRSAVGALAVLAERSRKQANVEVAALKDLLESVQTQAQISLSDLKSQLEVERQKLSTQLSEHQKAFADAQENRSTTYIDTIRKIQDSLANTLTDQQGQFSTAQENRVRE